MTVENTTPNNTSNLPVQPHPSDWVDHYGDMLFRIALSRVGNTEHAEDLVQETFLSGLRSIGTFQGNSSLGTWLVSILNNKIIDYHRRTYREIPLSTLDDNTEDRLFFRDASDAYEGHWLRHRGPQHIDQLHEIASMPDHSLEQKELQKFLLHCMQSLPQGMRQIFMMRTVDELDTSTICKDLGISESNVWTTLHRARLRVRQCIEKFYH